MTDTPDILILVSTTEMEALKADLARAEGVIDLLESNARVQAKLLADTGRERDELQAKLEWQAQKINELDDMRQLAELRAAKRYVAGLPSTGGIQAHGFRRCPVDDRACDCMQPCSVTSTNDAPRREELPRELIDQIRETGAFIRANTPPLTAAPRAPEPVAYRWRAPGNKHWIYDPTPEWVEDHKHEIELEPLYALPPALEQQEDHAITEASEFIKSIQGRPTPRLSAEQLAAWFFHDCNVAVYAYGELAEEMLRYFDVHPLEGVAVHLPSVTSPNITEALRLLRKISDLAYDAADIGEPLDLAIDYANKAIAALSSQQGPLVPWELDCQRDPTQCTAPECDCPAVSSTSDSPLMHAAEKAARAVDGWSDSKRQYAERATAAVTSTDGGSR